MQVIGKGSISRLDGKPGSPRSRCRKWRLKVHTEDGLKTRRVDGTWTQAQHALNVFIDELVDAPLEKSTFEAYAAQWLEYRIKSGEFAKRTTDKNTYSIKAINLHIGRMELTAIKPEHIRNMYIALREGCTLSGKPYSGTSLNQLHITLKMILEAAVDDELINRNPLSKIKPPKLDTQERAALSSEQMRAFLEQLDNRSLRGQIVAIKIAILTGMRRSEIVALRWCDYDGRNIHVRFSAANDGSLKKPKTKKSIRTIPLTSGMRSTLDRWHKIQANRLAKIGISIDADTRIVTEKNGSMILPGSIGRWWNRNRKDFGLKTITMHELRHSYLTRLVHSTGNLKAVQDIAGHSTIDVTMGVYAHTDEDKMREAVEAFEQEIGLEGMIRGTSRGTNG